jgi:hypothetical protein
MKVLVMVGFSVIEERIFKSESRAIRFASSMQDRGFKVRIID